MVSTLERCEQTVLLMLTTSEMNSLELPSWLERFRQRSNGRCEPKVYNIDRDETQLVGIAPNILRHFQVYYIRDARKVPTRIVSTAQLSKLRPPYVFWRRETLSNTFVALFSGPSAISNALHGVQRSEAIAVPRSKEELEQVLVQYPALIFGYPHCPYYMKAIHAIHNANRTDFVTLDMTHASDQIKHMVARRLGRAQWSSPLVYQRDDANAKPGEIVWDGTETVRYLTRATT